MAAGRPVVLAIDGVIREVVEAAGCGIFAEPGNPSALADAIRTLAADKDKARQMGLDGRKYLEENFSRAVIGEKLLELLEEILEMGKGNRHHVRVPGYDYTSPGAYFVTVVAYQREMLFGEIAKEEMRLNARGEIVLEFWSFGVLA